MNSLITGTIKRVAGSSLSKVIPDRLLWELMALPYVPYNGPDRPKDVLLSEGDRIAQRIVNETKSEYDFDIQNSRILEIGGGVGRVAIPMAKRGGEVHVTDISYGLLSKCKKFAEEEGVSIQTYQSRSSLRNVNQQFDFIYSVKVFQHIQRRTTLQYLVDSHSHLEGDGVMFFSVPNMNSDMNQENYLSSLDNRAPFRMRYFVPEELRLLTRMAGFKEVSIIENEDLIDVVAKA